MTASASLHFYLATLTKARMLVTSQRTWYNAVLDMPLCWTYPARSCAKNYEVSQNSQNLITTNSATGKCERHHLDLLRQIEPRSDHYPAVEYYNACLNDTLKDETVVAKRSHSALDHGCRISFHSCRFWHPSVDGR